MSVILTTLEWELGGQPKRKVHKTFVPINNEAGCGSALVCHPIYWKAYKRKLMVQMSLWLKCRVLAGKRPQTETSVLQNKPTNKTKLAKIWTKVQIMVLLYICIFF
jgi:hypothetical protein